MTPPYLKSDTPRSRITTILWFLERGIREVAWGLSLLKPKDLMNIALWVIILSGISTSYHYGSSSPFASASSQSENIISSQAQTPGREVAVASLPSGPSGQLLPPGVLAAPYTYSNTYVRGQCTWYVAGRRQVPNNWGNARYWYPRAQAAGWSVGSTPAIAAIAWTPNGYYGHVALVEAIENGQVLVSEMNYIGPYNMSKRWVPISSFKYIY